MPDYTLATLLGGGTGQVVITAAETGPKGPPSFLALDIGAPIPPGTLPGTIIFRRSSV